MANSPLVRRGIQVEVETVDAAELDLALHSLGKEFLERAALGLSRLPLSLEDLPIAVARIRRFGSYDVCFMVSRTDAAIIVTIMRIWPTRERDRMVQLLRKIDMLAMLRGAAGI